LPVQFSIFIISGSSKSSKKHIPSLKNTDLRETVASGKKFKRDQKRFTYLYTVLLPCTLRLNDIMTFFRFLSKTGEKFTEEIVRHSRRVRSKQNHHILRTYYVIRGYPFIILFYKVRQTRFDGM